MFLRILQSLLLSPLWASYQKRKIAVATRSNLLLHYMQHGSDYGMALVTISTYHYLPCPPGRAMGAYCKYFNKN